MILKFVLLRAYNGVPVVCLFQQIDWCVAFWQGGGGRKAILLLNGYITLAKPLKRKTYQRELEFVSKNSKPTIISLF